MAAITRTGHSALAYTFARW